MAITEKGIYYPSDGEQPADILKDLKEMAESIDNSIEKEVQENKYDDSEIKQEQQLQNEKILKNTEINTTQDKQIENLQQENALLKSQIPIGKEKDEYISIKDSSNLPFKKFGIGGNDYQRTREGYNLLNTSNITNLTSDGMTRTVTKEGKIIYNGISTTHFNTWLNEINQILEAGEYTLKSNVDLSGKGFIQLQDENNSQITITTKTLILNISKPTTLKRMLIQLNPNMQFNNLELEVMLYKGTEEKPYEQYGAMPSIDYPSDVRACGDNIQLFDKDNITYTKGMYLQENGTEDTTYSDLQTTDYIEVYGDSFTLSGITYGQALSLCGYNQNKEFVTGKRYSNNSIITIQGEDIRFVRFSTHTNPQQQSDAIIKLEKGKIATPWSPYGKGCMEATKSGNILSLDENDWEQGVINLNNGANQVDSKRIRTAGYYEINGTEDLYCYTNEEYNLVNIHGYKEDGTWIIGYYKIDNSIYGASEIKINFNDPECKKIRVVIKRKDDTNILPTEIEKINPTISKEEREIYNVSTQELYYEGDTFVKIDGVRYEKHNYEKIILTGAEDWIFPNQTSYPSLFQISRVEDFSKALLETESKCNYFKFTTNLNNNGYRLIYSNSTSYIRIVNTNFTQISKFKEWLTELYNSGNPVRILYKSAEPKLIPCTAEQNAVLDEIENSSTYKNVTYIYSSDEISPIFDIEYYKDLDTIINNTKKETQSQIDEIKELLSTTGTSAMLLENLKTDLESEV